MIKKKTLNQCLWIITNEPSEQNVELKQTESTQVSDQDEGNESVLACREDQKDTEGWICTKNRD